MRLYVLKIIFVKKV